MTETFQTITPIDNTVYVERPYATAGEIASALNAAVDAQAAWRATSVADRARLCSAAVDAFVADKDAIAEEITRQMGRPIQYSPGEVAGFEERARHMIAIAPAALADVEAEPIGGFTRFIRHDPLGVVLTIAPWNYPYLTAVNSVVPAIMAGNAVVLKHSAQTPLCAERFSRAFEAAGLPPGVFQHLHLDHHDTRRIIAAREVAFVSFTGSVSGGRMVEEAASGRFLGVGLELGGKDPAYVRPDADLTHAAENLVDGAFFNSGQSCCGIERIYVHADVHDEFVERFADIVRGYVLGNPLDTRTTLGPMVRPAAAAFVRHQVAEAISSNARALIDPSDFPADENGSSYMAPQVLIGVDHGMRVMTEESFGPVVGIMKVASDDEAVALMNDSDYGLTASVWTQNASEAIRIGDRVTTGTWFMNRCDYLDPALAWSGVKDSGRGCALSPLGFGQLTRPKSYHLRTAI